MDIQDRIAVVTGAASGIGRALAIAFHANGAKQVICADLNGDGAAETAAMIGGVAKTVNVGVEADIARLVEETEAETGPIDIFCSNAGILVMGGLEVPNEDWDRVWDINVSAHMWAARHVIPRMVERGGGYLLNTSSAAGLLSHFGSTSYAVSKHAAVGLAEWLAINHGPKGIGVSVLCPQAVRTAMTSGRGTTSAAHVDGMMEPGPVAELCLEAIRHERFLVLPHPEVETYMRRKTADYGRWIGGMQRLAEKWG